MFATTAALMIRELGIPTRIANGFYVRKERLDSQSGEALVMPGDIHVWPEISLDGKYWIPIEPTPGFQQPAYALSLWQRLTLAAIAIRDAIVGHPILVSLLVICCVLIYRCRAWLKSGMHTVCWHALLLLSPGRAVEHTTKLIDQRSRLAGIPRPIFMSPTRFHRQLFSSLSGIEEDTEAFNRFCRCLERWLYHPLQERPPESDVGEVLRDCRAVVSAFGYRGIKQLQRSS